jgi:hypothetical protein
MLTPKTQLEKDLAEKDASIIRAATALHYAATVLEAENARFWALPDDRLLAVLNDNAERTLAMFAANEAAANAMNALLDQVGDETLTHRAPVAAGRSDILFDGTTFSIAPKPEPAPTQDEE